jgi:GNAT superfamily N-acetyltransferase
MAISTKISAGIEDNTVSTTPRTYRFAHRHYAEALYQALGEDAFYTTMEQSIAEPKQRREGLLRYLDYSMCEADEYGILHFPQTHQYGVAVWSTPLALERAAECKRHKHEFLQQHMGANSAASYDAIVDFMSQQSEAVVDASAWYLSITGILPGFQNRGLGSELVRATLVEADRAGVATFLETFVTRNEPFYQRLGYRVAGRFFEPTIASNYAIMVRDCKA